MGLIGYCWGFIQGFSKIAYPINSFQNKEVKFVWSLKCQDSFEILKILLTMDPILKVVDPCKDYIVCTYASKEGLGGILSQEGHMLCYESLKLK